MKKFCLMLAVLALGCSVPALADTDLSQFDASVYDELSMDEIPDGELTGDLLSTLEDAHTDRIFDELLPWLVEKGYVRDVPRSGCVNEESKLWIRDIGSFMDLWLQLDTVPLEEMPTSLVHCSPSCDPDATVNCNVFAIGFWGLEDLFAPCPMCYPEGWVYDYLLSCEYEDLNQLYIGLRTEAVPGRFDEPRNIVASFDHGTDECLAVAVQYTDQAYVIVYQSERLTLQGILSACERCSIPGKDNPWDNLEPGLWHCQACGSITRVEAE
ncbi:MAG: hypothetical protein ACI4O7_07610 [Aristaeellaceae bacterium]